MTTNTWENFDPSYPYGIDFVDIWVEEDPEILREYYQTLND